MRIASRLCAFLAGLLALALAYLVLELPLHEKMAAPLLRSSPLSRLLPQRFTTTLTSPRVLPTLSTQTIASKAAPSNFSRPLTSTTTPASMDSKSFKEAVALRRSIYQLNKKAPIDDKKIQEIVRTAVKEVPSSFNSQSTRVVVLLNDDHDAFWDIVKDILKAHVPEDKWEHTGSRIQGFRNGYGTV